MSSELYHNVHIFFFPFLAQGHMIPTVDMAKLFASKGVKSTIITTPFYAPFISKSIQKAKTNGHNIDVTTIEFPSPEVTGLPNGCENVDTIPPQLFHTFCKALKFLQEPLEQKLLDQHPNCVVADMFFPWVTDSAAKFGIPRLVFHGACFFSMCATECMRLYNPYKNISSDSELFVVPNLPPGDIKMTKLQAPNFYDKEFTGMATLMQQGKESELKSYGVVVNSFYELEKVYADFFTNVLGRKAWHIGPLSLSNKDSEEKANRGNINVAATIDEHECLKWLDMKKPNSVVYICFGSMAYFPDSQLRDIALGLEASGQQFIWVVRRKNNKELEDGEEWLPEGFEKRMEGKGLIIRGWAPQVLILEHEAIGAFVTHCGWNSTLEGVTAGVPMVTWPLGAEQFYNEKLVTEVLQIGVAAGVEKWSREVTDVIVKWDAVEKTVKEIMEGEKALERRNKAKELSLLAKRAVDEGGSSHSDLIGLIQELGSLSH